jgi:hypothetical protein
MKRTTILADDDVILDLQQLAIQRRTTFTAVVQDALRSYVAEHQPRRHIAFAGMGHSGMPPLDVSDGKDEDILATEIDPIYGWEPRLHNAESTGRLDDDGGSR